MNGMDWLRGRGLSGNGIRVGIIDAASEHREQVAALVRSSAPDCIITPDSALGRRDTVAALAGALDGMIEEGVQIISMPFGFPHAVSVLMPLLRVVRERGIVLFAAAGNEAHCPLPFPASSPDVFAVGMSELPYRPAPDLRAPGLRLPNPLDPASTLSGASYSCALVTGLAALLCEAFPCGFGDALIRSRDGLRVPDGRRALELLAAGFVAPPLAAPPDETGPIIDPRFMDSLRYSSAQIEGIAVLRQPLPASASVQILRLFPHLNACRMEADAAAWRELADSCDAIGPVNLSGAQFMPLPCWP